MYILPEIKNTHIYYGQADIAGQQTLHERVAKCCHGSWWSSQPSHAVSRALFGLPSEMVALGGGQESALLVLVLWGLGKLHGKWMKYDDRAWVCWDCSWQQWSSCLVGFEGLDGYVWVHPPILHHTPIFAFFLFLLFLSLLIRSEWWIWPC